MRTHTQFIRILLAAALIISCMVPGAAWAEGKYAFSDQKTATTLIGGANYISGNHLVWTINNKIFYKNVSTGKVTQVSKTTLRKSTPVVTELASGHVYVLWYEMSQGGAWSLYSRNLNTGTEAKLNGEEGVNNGSVSVDGPYVVWMGSRYNMYYSDLRQPQEMALGNGRNPVVHGGKIVYKRVNGGLNEFNIATGETRNLLELPYHIYVVDFAFNGKYVLWRQSDMDHNEKYVILNTLDPKASPQDLTLPEKNLVNYPALLLNEHMGIWIEKQGDVAVVTGLDLKGMNTFEFLRSKDAWRVLGLTGNRLILEGEGRALGYRVVTGIDITASARPADPALPAPAPKLASPGKPIKVIMDGAELALKEKPIVLNGSVMVPLKSVLEQLGLKVEVDENDNRLSASNDRITVKVAIGSRKAELNGNVVALAAPISYKSGVWYAPIGFMEQLTNKAVAWDSRNATVTVKDMGIAGKLYYADGTLLYEGLIWNGKMHGSGKMYRADGDVWYIGEFADDQMTGYGTLYYPNGRNITGYFKNGLPNGKGKYYNEKGILWYEGEFKDGVKDGYGKSYDWNRGTLLYEGDWKDNMKNGFGKEYAENKVIYEGGYLNNARHGKGKLFDQYGELKREGTFVNGYLHGEGTGYTSRGEKFIGRFDHTAEIATGKLYDEDGKLIAEGRFNYWSLKPLDK